MPPDRILAMIDAAAATIAANAEELTRLDQAIGDGDLSMAQHRSRRHLAALSTWF